MRVSNSFLPFVGELSALSWGGRHVIAGSRVVSTCLGLFRCVSPASVPVGSEFECDHEVFVLIPSAFFFRRNGRQPRCRFWLPLRNEKGRLRTYPFSFNCLVHISINRCRPACHHNYYGCHKALLKESFRLDHGYMTGRTM